MNFVRSPLDFLLGILMIGGAPLSVVGVTMIAGRVSESVFHTHIPESAVEPMMVTTLIVAFCSLVWALWHRARRRLIPYDFIYLEAIFGLVGASALFSLYGFIVHFLID